jgi:hypothetical protein
MELYIYIYILSHVKWLQRGIGLTVGFIGFSNTACDYTYKSLLYSDQCSQSRCLVTAPTADVPLLPGSRPFRLATTLTLMASLPALNSSANCQQLNAKVALRLMTSRSVSPGFESHVGLVTGH